MSLVRVHRQGVVVTLTLNRPEARNALSADLCRAVAAALIELEDDPEARVLLVRGEGSVFCSGADLAALSGPAGLDFIEAFETMLESVARSYLPTVAAIQGAALGGGLQLATVCDFRIAAGAARLGIPSSRLGVVVNFENVERLVQLCGIPLAKEILMAGRMLDGDEAVIKGLVTVTHPPEDLDAAAGDFAAQIGELAPLSVQGAKRSIRLISEAAKLRERDPASVVAIDALVAEAYASHDLAEGMRALADKRKPDFKGR